MTIGGSDKQIRTITMNELIAFATNYPILSSFVAAVSLPYGARITDKIFGQPRDGGNFDDKRENKVWKAYRRIAYATTAGVILYGYWWYTQFHF